MLSLYFLLSIAFFALCRMELRGIYMNSAESPFTDLLLYYFTILLFYCFTDLPIHRFTDFRAAKHKRILYVINHKESYIFFY